MKKILFALIFLISSTICFISKTLPVQADSAYMRVITEDTPFFSHYNDTEPLFYLPYTYYVKVIGYESGYSHVECYGKNSVKIDGYVPTDFLYDDGLSVENPYVEIKIYTITPSIIYQDSDTSTPLQYVFPSRQLDFYGVLPTEECNLYYVGYNGKLGYVKETEIQPFSIENHPNELTFLQTDLEIQPNDTPSDVQQGTQQPTNNETLKIVIIVCLTLAGIIGFFVVTKKRTQPEINQNSYYDENEYE